MKIVNLTPHEITLVNGSDDPVLTIEPSGIIARCTSKTEEIGSIIVDGIEIPETKTSLGEVYDLPDKKAGVIYVVSLQVAKSLPERDDLRIPDQSVRNKKGQIIGCKSLGRV